MQATAFSPVEAVDAIEAPASYQLVFPEGLVGCPNWTTFVLLTDDDQDLPVAYLQSAEDSDVRLLITDPRLIDASYTAPLSEDDRAAIDLAPSDTAVTYCTLTINPDGLITANLLGPLVINSRTRMGRQLVMTDSGYSTRQPVTYLAKA